MSHPRLSIDADFAAVIRGLYSLHRLGLADGDDSPDAETIRDEIDGPWANLTDWQREQAGWFSEWLYLCEDK